MLLCGVAMLTISCQDDESSSPAESFITVVPESGATVSTFRNTTVTVDILVTSSADVTSITVNGNPVTFTSGKEVRTSYTYQVPEDGIEYTLDIEAESAAGSDEAQVDVNIVPGPALAASTLEPLMEMKSQFSNVTIETLVSTSDELDTYNTLGGFRLAGSADGMGMVENEDGNFELLVNCEDHYSVARITLDQNLRPLKGDYLLNSSVADFARQCSGTMWEADIHGGSQDLFISSSETFNYTSRGIDPYIFEPAPGADYNLPALGQFGWENNVPLPQGAYPGKTVIIGGDDDSGSFAGGAEGQVALYVSDAGDADLTGGKVYVLRLEGATAPSTEGDLAFGQTYDVEFVEVTGSNVDEYDIDAANKNSLQFMRVEDLDYGKGSDAAGRIVYFAVTGRGPGRGTYNDWGTGYKLVLDSDNPLKGELTQIISGNTAGHNNEDGNIDQLQSPDNIVVTENFIYWQEDPNSFDRGHNAYIYQTDLNGGNVKVFCEFLVNNDLVGPGVSLPGDNGEYGAMIDVSDKVGEEGTFILALQPHYYTNNDFQALDGHDLGIPPGFPGEDNQGSQIVILRNVPR